MFKQAGKRFCQPGVHQLALAPSREPIFVTQDGYFYSETHLLSAGEGNSLYTSTQLFTHTSPLLKK